MMSKQAETADTAVEREDAPPAPDPALAGAPEADKELQVTGPKPDAMGRLSSIQVQAAVQLGTARLLVRDLAALSPGCVIQLDRMVGEPADLRINGHLFARGEVVVVDDYLGLRITEIE